MVAHGAVLVAHDDALGAELRRRLFERAAPEFFAIPADVKRSLVSAPIHGYIGPRPKAPAYESSRVWDSAVDGRDVVQRHNRSKMILEGLGVGKERIDSHLRSLNYSARLSRYGSLAEMGNETFMQEHKDCNVLSLLVQHEVDGLELQVNDGSWLAVPAEPGAFAVVAGELLTVVTTDEREGAGERPPRQDAERPRAGLGAVRVEAKVWLDGAPGGGARRRGASSAVQYLQLR
nr:unnamed protein product [Digitaria exilis]